MELLNWKKVCLGVFGTVFLGALGAGLWETALKPSGIWLGKTVLTVATFGSSAVRDDIYREAARGVHEACGLQLLWLVILVMGSFCSFFLGSTYGKRTGRRIRVSFMKSLEVLDEEKRLSELKRNHDSSKRRLNKVIFTSIGLAFLFVTFQLIEYLKLNQANATYTYFAQSMSICRPYIDDKQSHMLESRFAGINGRNDYIGIIDDLRQIASSNQRKLPDFSPW